MPPRPARSPLYGIPLPCGGEAPTRSLLVSPAHGRSFHGNARLHPGDPEIELPGLIRSYACADRALPHHNEMSSASPVGARATMERWGPVVVGFSAGRLAGCDRRAWPGLPNHGERAHCAVSRKLPARWRAPSPNRVSHPV
jgi:hypothetical protein